MVTHGIPHHKVVMVCMSQLYLGMHAMFIPLHSRMNQELLEKYVCFKVATMKSTDSAMHPSYRLKLKYPFPFSVSYVQLIIKQYKSRTV